MPDFTYTARSLSGASAKGTLAAASEREALAILDQRGLLPVRIEEVKVETQKRFLGFGRRIKPRYLATLYSQLADLLRSGVPLLKSLEILERQSSVPAMTATLRTIREDVADGTSLADAMARHSRAFNELTVSMIRAGQEGGFLEDVLRRIADFTDHQEDLKSKVIGALAYPVFLSVVGTVIVMALVIFLVPRFAEMFEQQRAAGTLPWPTRALLSISGFLEGSTSRGLLDSGALWLAVGFFGLWFAYRAWANTPNGRWIVDGLKLRVPIAGAIFRNLAIARFCRILGTLLHNGIEILHALRIAKDSTGNRRLTAAIDQATENVRGGESLAQPLRLCGHFPRDIVEMVAVGEESNNLETVLIAIADGLEKRTTRQLDLFVRLLEPVMLLVMAFITLMVVLALLMPFLSMGQLVN